VRLVCDEQATFGAGTDRRIETKRVRDLDVFGRTDLSIDRALPLVETFDLDVPSTVMHSFEAVHNKVHWTLLVHGEPDGWPAFERAFPVVIHPPTAGKERKSRGSMNQPGLPIMSHPQLTIEFDRKDFEAGETLTGRYRLPPEIAATARSVEIVVAWNSEGKGNDDRGIQCRQTRTTREYKLFDSSGIGAFSVELPMAPLSYAGIIVKINWSVHVRIEVAHGEAFDESRWFRLGHVEAASEPAN
jgi:hypothetical protein